MDEFSSLEEFEQLPKSNYLIEEEKEVFNNQSFTIAKENDMIESCRNDLCIDSLIDKPLQISNAISDAFLEGMDVGLRFEDGIENHEEASLANERCEQVGLNENAISKDVSKRADVKLEFDNSIDRHEQINEVVLDAILLEGVDMSSKFVHGSKNQGELVENMQSDMLKSCKIEEYECGVNDTRVNRVVVLALGVDSCEKFRQDRKPKTTPMKIETLGRRVKKKGKEKDVKSNDEFARMRKHLKYLLHRISYEQNYLDAYSSEGWRGQSLEKLRPEKELQRAKADIYRSKLKIRDLFQRIDSISSQGKFPESLYDSDGLIDSEDIFCAKCGTNDSSPGNDILLCDGVCDRGFHQNCLNPPLPTEKIPPGDEGWLCPACDCKVDCYNLLNDYHGTKLTIEDSWEEVFPEAIATPASNNLDDIMGLPSDDSDDNEYNPNNPNDDPISDRNESSSDESSDSSDFSSASEDLGAICAGAQNLVLPSDDSDDDDFDPDATNVNEDGVGLGSSGSDFSSASEDLGGVIGGQGTLDQGQPPLPLDLDGPSPISGKRCAERLDYKKLYDETFGNAPSDSSDDEEWAEMVPTRKRKKKTEIKITPRGKGKLKANNEPANGLPTQLDESSQKKKSSSSNESRPPCNKLGEAVTKRLYESFKENQCPDHETKEKLANEVGLTLHRVHKWFANARWNLHHHPSQMEARMNRIISSTTIPASVACNELVHVKSVGSSERRPQYNQLGETVTKRLHEAFKENQYPNREMKEKLANELGLKVRQVNKWFANARWSFRHHPSRMEARMNEVISSSTTPHNVACNGIEASVTVSDGAKSDLPECGRAFVVALPECGGAKKLTPRTPKVVQGNQLSENPKAGTLGDPLQGPEITQGRAVRKRRKSIA